MKILCAVISKFKIFCQTCLSNFGGKKDTICLDVSLPKKSITGHHGKSHPEAQVKRT